MSLVTSLLVRMQATLSGSNDLGTPSFPLDYKNLFNLPSGTAASQADLIFSDTRTLGASATEDLDLAGSLVDPLGATLAFVTVKAIIVKAAAGNTNNVAVKPAAANGFIGPFNAAADTLIVPPSGVVVLVAPVSGWAVTAGTGDLITVTNSGAGTGVTYDVVIVGTSA